MLASWVRSLFEYYGRLCPDHKPRHTAMCGNRAPIRLAYGANVRSLLQEMVERRQRPPVWQHRSKACQTVQPVYRRLALDRQQTIWLSEQAKRRGLNLNDLLHVTIIRTIDEIRHFPNGTISACMPVNLRRYTGGRGRFANLTSGVYLYFSSRAAPGYDPS